MTTIGWYIHKIKNDQGNYKFIIYFPNETSYNRKSYSLSYSWAHLKRASTKYSTSTTENYKMSYKQKVGKILEIIKQKVVEHKAWKQMKEDSNDGNH